MALTNSINSDSKLEKPISLIWGCELSAENTTCTFKMPDDWAYEQQLALRMICVGEKTNDELNIVEIIPPEDSQDPSPVVLAALKPSVLPMAPMVGVELTPPVTFRLRAGSGPVYITGQHINCQLFFAVVPDDSWMEEEEEEEEEEEYEEESFQEESPQKATKRQPYNKKASVAKKKVEKEEVSNPVRSDEDAPPNKGKGAGRGRKPAAKK
ncbi:nucleoplasmin-2 isoform X2 [Alligator mississippiensis]|uniref:Nucleoplasmin-2 n=1 Tax=Alligator mississippiensis TaxID=8496 RepID=A0A151NBG1_ALLMI|nr:nucleoplasmin-2 isoform X2 [Alligator mississippiensis]KYO34158.1 nucleoplasmin-2 [Alligator mississippiensis]